jgi:diguanylate cyclase (GGDEF)-like protein
MKKLFSLSMRTVTIGQFSLLLSAGIVLFAAVMVLLLSTFIERRAITDLAHEDARQTSELVFQSLYSAMRKGWDKDEIQDIIQRLNETLPEATIRVFRGPPVIRQFGEINGEANARQDDDLLTKALQNGEESLVQNENTLRYLYPVVVREECLACHDAKVGDINGVVDVTFPINNLKVSLGFVIRSVIIYFSVVLTIICVAVYFKLRFFVAFPISQFVSIIDEIIQHTDLSKRVRKHTSHISEIERLSEHFNRLLGTIQDYHERLRTYSERDPLTNLYNRRKFEEFLKIEVERGMRHDRSFSLIMMDVDNFKHINDTYGHPVGDLALKELSAVLEKRMRRTDVIARLGGDEFAILLPDTDQEKGLMAAENLRRDLGETVMHLPVGNTRVHASFGLVTFPDNGADVEKLTIAMDVAMYKAKRLGKNRVATMDAMEEGLVMEVFNKGQQIQSALSEDRIIPFFQPITPPGSDKPYAYEVLARLREGEITISAGQFIESAEELGLARAIDEAVFRKGIAEAARSGAAQGGSQGIKLFFNLSARTIGDIDWMRGLPEVVRQEGLEPCQIVLEITEREALPNFDKLIELMAELRDQGIAFALDDFGSGFSSFLYLKYLTVDYVKIEGSFVRHMASDQRDQVMVHHIHSMAHEFGLKTIAEFVEDEETSRLLVEMGVDFAQGYHLGRPSATIG